MTSQQLVSRIGKGLLAANGAVVVRALFHGLQDLDSRIYRAYSAIDPFGASEVGARKWMDSIPSVHLGEIVGELANFKVDSDYRFLDGALPWVDLVPMLTIAHQRMPRCILEIGTFYGYTSRLLALNFPNSVIHTIDLPLTFDLDQDESPIPKDDFHLIQSRRVGEGFRSDPSIKNVVQHYGDTATWDFSPAKDATLFFIDGSHTYEYIKNDTEKCLALCKGRRATFLWHDVDLGHPGVVKYLAELSGKDYPVKRIEWTHMAIMDV